MPPKIRIGQAMVGIMQSPVRQTPRDFFKAFALTLGNPRAVATSDVIALRAALGVGISGSRPTV